MTRPTWFLLTATLVVAGDLSIALVAPSHGEAQVRRGDGEARERGGTRGGRTSRGDRVRQISHDVDWVGIALFAVAGPMIALDDPMDTRWRWADHPYADDVDGHAVLPQGGPDDPPIQDVAVQGRVEGGYAWPAMGRASADVRVVTPFRSTFGAGYTALLGAREGGGVEHQGLVGGRVGLLFAQDEYLQFRLDIGMLVFHDAQGEVWGGELRYGVDIFPIRPLVISIEAIGGPFEDDSFFFGGRVTVGVLAGPVELYLGYDHLEIVPMATRSLRGRMSGPIGGVRFWI